MEKNNVLIIDDDKFLSDMYLMKFGQAGFKVQVAGTGMDALTRISDGYNPDIILLDLVMPAMDGFEFLAELKKKSLAKDAILIILSNLGQKEEIDRGLKLGVDGYIVKASCTPSEVLMKVQEIIKVKIEHK